MSTETTAVFSRNDGTPFEGIDTLKRYMAGQREVVLLSKETRNSQIKVGDIIADQVFTTAILFPGLQKITVKGSLSDAAFKTLKTVGAEIDATRSYRPISATTKNIALICAVMLVFAFIIAIPFLAPVLAPTAAIGLLVCVAGSLIVFGTGYLTPLAIDRLIEMVRNRMHPRHFQPQPM